MKETIIYRQPNDEPFARGTKEFQELAGGFRFFQFHNTDNDYPSIDYVLNTLRLGVMLNDPRGHGFFAGNFEFLGELFGGAIVQGPGDGIAGATLIFRYNFIQPARAVCAIFPDRRRGCLHRRRGEEIGWPNQSAGGIQSPEHGRPALFPERSLVARSARFGYRHISNAGLHSPNVGVDSLGGNVGIGFSF